jgi:transposase
MTRRPDTNRSARRSSRAGKSLEPTGPETFALVDTPLGKLMARVPGKVHQQIGEQVFLQIADNYATHKHPAVQEWLAKHPRFNMHFTPTSASCLNMVERFFRDLTTERLRRVVFTGVPELVTAIDEYVTHHNTDPKPFIWTKSARDILQKVIRANSRLSSKRNTALAHLSRGLTLRSSRRATACGLRMRLSSNDLPRDVVRMVDRNRA